MPNTRRSSLRRNSGSNARASSMVRDLHSRGANRLDNALDDMGSVDAVGMRGVVKHDAMCEAGDGDSLDILTRDVGASVEQRTHLGAENKRLGAARTRAEHHVAIHHLVVHAFGLVGDEARVLRLSRSPQARGVNLVAEQDMAERGTGLEGELAASIFTGQNHASAGDIRGHQIDGELNSIEAQVEREPERLDQRGFAGAGNALDENVAAREQRGEQLLDRLFVPDDYFVDLSLDTPKGPREIRHGRRFRQNVTHISKTLSCSKNSLIFQIPV